MSPRFVWFPVVVGCVFGHGSVALADGANPFDVNGDGRQDLVAGAWTKRSPQEGAAVVVLSKSNGARRRLIITQSTPGVPGSSDPPEAGFVVGDRFGVSVASGDFDADGYAELAIGAPRERFESAGSVLGAVTVLPGSRAGPTPERAVRFFPPPTSTPNLPVAFGASLVASDLNRDGYADLVIGAPGQDRVPPYRPNLDNSPELPPFVPGRHGFGAIHLLFGGPSGLSTDRARTLARPRVNDWAFGETVAVGDVNRDGYPDLIEGAYGDPFESQPGQSAYCPGRRGGPRVCRPLGDASRPGPTSIAIGDLTGDRYPEIVVGIPERDFDDRLLNDADGIIKIWRGTRSGPRKQAIALTMFTAGLENFRPWNYYDKFGSCVAVGDVDGDGHADVIASTAREAGTVTLIRGARHGYARPGVVLYRARAYRPTTDFWPEPVLTLLDLDGDGERELPVYVRNKNGDAAVRILDPRTHRRRAHRSPLLRRPFRSTSIITLGRVNDSGCV